MQCYYFLAVVCCIMPFILGGIWFFLHDNGNGALTEAMTASSLVISAEDLIKEYSFSESSNRFNGLLKNLKKVCLYDPKTRDRDYMDVWFLHHTSEIMHDGGCLAYINHYGHLEDTFWKNVEELNLSPEKDVELQKMLIGISVDHFGCKFSNFGNLLFHFGMKWELLPEIKEILNTDPNFTDPKETYRFARECAKKKKRLM